MGQIALTLPQSNLPNATEDPKIVSDFTLIQNVINGNIDPSNLSPTGGIMRLVARNTATNTAAAAGELIVTTAVPVTVTLPAPVANGLVGVISCGFASGASPTTVAGTNIFGVGANGVTSFKLGAPFATVLMQSDGTNWFIVSGQQDTGWVALPFGASYHDSSGGFTQYRKAGEVVTIRGTTTRNSGTVTAGDVIATLPIGFRPPAIEGFVAISGTASQTSCVQIFTDGTLVVTEPGGGSFLFLGRVGYNIT